MNSNFVFIILVVIILFLYYKLQYGETTSLKTINKSTIKYNPAIIHPACL